MAFQSEVWELLSDDEYNFVWDRVYTELRFCPSVKRTNPPFVLNYPFVIYDISKLPLDNDDYYTTMEKTIRDIFIECLGNDDYMYALDWQHSGFRYNPRIMSPKPDSFIKDERYCGGGYNAYFPDFYPDGDYYFFIAKDFSWGYLGHPWFQKVWVFGKSLIKSLAKKQEILQFIFCEIQ